MAEGAATVAVLLQNKAKLAFQMDIHVARASVKKVLSFLRRKFLLQRNARDGDWMVRFPLYVQYWPLVETLQESLEEPKAPRYPQLYGDVAAFLLMKVGWSYLFKETRSVGRTWKRGLRLCSGSFKRWRCLTDCKLACGVGHEWDPLAFGF